MKIWTRPTRHVEETCQLDGQGCEAWEKGSLDIELDLQSMSWFENTRSIN